MQRPGFIKILLLVMVFIFICTLQVEAIDIGGEIEINSGLLYQDDIHSYLSGRGELELYLPQSRNVSSRLVLKGSLAQEQNELGIKYLYLRHRRDDGHITLGRQPVSWSYGAMINPYDFGFGLEGFADETLTPDIDGVRYFHGLGEGRSLQLAAEFAEGHYSSLDRMGYGARVRLPAAGYDLSFNLAAQPVLINQPVSEDNLLRVGGTYSGDIGPAGIYGALGYYRLLDDDRDDYVAQLGFDYSWQVGPQYEERTIFLQAEYLRFLNKELGLLFFQQFSDELTTQGAEPGNMTENAAQNFEVYDLLAANLSLQLDPFSRVGAAFIGESGEGMVTLIPFYQTELGGGLEFRIEGNLMQDFYDDFGAGFSAGLSYYF